MDDACVCMWHHTRAITHFSQRTDFERSHFSIYLFMPLAAQSIPVMFCMIGKITAEIKFISGHRGHVE